MRVLLTLLFIFFLLKGTMQGCPRRIAPYAAKTSPTCIALIAERPAIVFLNQFDDLLYSRASDELGSAFPINVNVDDSRQTLKLSQSLCDVSGAPAISYAAKVPDGDNFLYYVRSNTTTGLGAWWTPMRVSPSERFDGAYSVLRMIGDKPSIAFVDSYRQTLHYVRGVDAIGSTWMPVVTVDGRGNTQSTCISLLAIGTASSGYRAAIAYSDGDLTWVASTDANGTAWAARKTLDSEEFTGTYASMRIIDGRPAIAYNGYTGVRFMHAAESDGDDWSLPSTITTTATTTAVVNLLETADGVPSVVGVWTSGSDKHVMFARALDTPATTWTWRIVDDDYDSEGFVSSYTAAAILDHSTSVPLVVWANDTGLWVARSADANGNLWPDCIQLTDAPTEQPTTMPTKKPSPYPTPYPTIFPTLPPVKVPTSEPPPVTSAPTAAPLPLTYDVVLEQECVQASLELSVNASLYVPGDALRFCVRVQNEKRHTRCPSPLDFSLSLPARAVNAGVSSVSCDKSSEDFIAEIRTWLYPSACPLSSNASTPLVEADGTDTLVRVSLLPNDAFRGYIAVPPPFDTCLVLSYDADTSASTVRLMSRTDGMLSDVGIVRPVAPAQRPHKIAYDPISRVTYASSGSQFGVIDFGANGAFTVRGTIGSCRGVLGSGVSALVPIVAVAALAVHPYSQEIWAISLVESNGQTTILYRIEMGTSSANLCARDTFGSGVDFLELRPSGENVIVADLTFDMAMPAPTMFLVLQNTQFRGHVMNTLVATRDANGLFAPMNVTVMTVGGGDTTWLFGVRSATIAADGRLYVLVENDFVLQVSRDTGTAIKLRGPTYYYVPYPELVSTEVQDVECYTHPPSVDLGPAAYEVCVDATMDAALTEMVTASARAQWQCDGDVQTRNVAKSLTQTTRRPTMSPSHSPSTAPTQAPSEKPTAHPTASPTRAPSKSPTYAPTKRPTATPTSSPSEAPTASPSDAPTRAPSKSPTHKPSTTPTLAPSDRPTLSPTDAPSDRPTKAPQRAPTSSPTDAPSDAPTNAPSDAPTDTPTSSPTHKPTSVPTKQPSASPTDRPTLAPTRRPTQSPHAPTAAPIFLHYEAVIENECMLPTVNFFSNVSLYRYDDHILYCLHVSKTRADTSADSISVSMLLPGSTTSLRLYSAICDEYGVDSGQLPRPWLQPDECVFEREVPEFVDVAAGDRSAVSFDLPTTVAFRGYVAVPSPFDTCFILSYDNDEMSTYVHSLSRNDGVLSTVSVVRGLDSSQQVDTIALDPASGTMFASAGPQFGVIALLSGGTFVSRGAIGACRGRIGGETTTVFVSSLSALAVHPYTQEVWAVMNVTRGAIHTSILFKIQGFTRDALCERDVFENGIDFMELTFATSLVNIVGLSFDMKNVPGPTLFAVAESASMSSSGATATATYSLHSNTRTLNVTTMIVGLVDAPNLLSTIRSASIAADGRLYVLGDQNNVLQLRRADGSAIRLRGPRDYYPLFPSMDSVDAIDLECFTQLPSFDLGPAAYEVCVSMAVESQRGDTLTARGRVEWRCDGEEHQLSTDLVAVAETNVPTYSPTKRPTLRPTRPPTKAPSAFPTGSPTRRPTVSPSSAPTGAPTQTPTSAPTNSPTDAPSDAPTATPTRTPTKMPSHSPTRLPTERPSPAPTVTPDSPSRSPVTPLPTDSPSTSPSVSPTDTPSRAPSQSPTLLPSAVPVLYETTVTSVSVSSTTAFTTIAAMEIISCNKTSGDVSIDLVRALGTVQSRPRITDELPRCPPNSASILPPSVPLTIESITDGVLSANDTSFGVRSESEAAGSIGAFTLGGREGLRFSFERPMVLGSVSLRGGGGRSEALISIDNFGRKRAQSTVLIFSGQVEHVNSGVLDSGTRFDLVSGAATDDAAAFGVLRISFKHLNDSEVSVSLPTTLVTSSSTEASADTTAEFSGPTATSTKGTTAAVEIATDDSLSPATVGIALGVTCGVLLLIGVLLYLSCRLLRRRKHDRALQNILKQSGRRSAKQAVGRRRSVSGSVATHSTRSFASLNLDGDNVIRMARLRKESEDVRSLPRCYTLDDAGYVRLKKIDAESEEEEHVSEATSATKSPRRKKGRRSKKPSVAAAAADRGYMPVPARTVNLADTVRSEELVRSMDTTKTIEQEIEWISPSPRIKSKKKKAAVQAAAAAPGASASGGYVAIPQKLGAVQSTTYQALPVHASQESARTQYMAVPEKRRPVRADPNQAALIQWLPESDSSSS